MPDTNEGSYTAVSFLLRNLIEAFRRGEHTQYKEIIDVIRKFANKSLFKYHAVLKPYGYEIYEINQLFNHYLLEFINEYEFPNRNIVKYFIGFIDHKFYKIVERETVFKRKTNSSYVQLDKALQNFEIEHSIVDNAQVFYEVDKWYLYDEICKLIEEGIGRNIVLEKEELDILKSRIKGLNLFEISEVCNMTYKKVNYIYHAVTEKLRTAYFAA